MAEAGFLCWVVAQGTVALVWHVHCLHCRGKAPCVGRLQLVRLLHQNVGVSDPVATTVLCTGKAVHSCMACTGAATNQFLFVLLPSLVVVHHQVCFFARLCVDILCHIANGLLAHQPGCGGSDTGGGDAAMPQ